jgi:hypothetical protein
MSKNKNNLINKLTIALILILLIAPFIWFNNPKDKSKTAQAEVLTLEQQKKKLEKIEEKVKLEKEQVELKSQSENLLKKSQELQPKIEELNVQIQTNNFELKIEEKSNKKTMLGIPKTEIKVEAKEINSIPSIQSYISTYFPDTPVTAEMLANQSKKSKVPVGFILAAGHNESHMGTKGRAVETQNVFNVGNTDAGDYKPTVCGQASNCLSNWQQGLDAFTDLITKCYFNENEEIKLETWISRDFRAVRCDINGKRYMTNPNALNTYQERIKNLQHLNINY